MSSIRKQVANGIVAGWLLVSATVLLFPLSAKAQTGGYTEIRTKAELAAVRDDLDGRYRLMADIVFTAQDFSESGDYYQFGRFWRPIGYDADNAFTGEFDGNGFSVRGLQVNAKGSYAGLFGFSRGNISNLNVTDCTIKASGYNYDMVYAGGVVGYNAGSISSCRVNGTVEAISESMFNNTYAGGIAGLTETGTIQNCHTATTVRAYTTGHTSYHDFHGGGIVGCVKSGSVKACTSTGTVRANYAGGVVGLLQNGTVESCWNAGALALDGYSEIYAGGVIGRLFGGTVRDCYNSGAVRAEASNTVYVGGVVGHRSGGTLGACYNIGEVKAQAKASTNTCLVGGVVGEGDGSGCYYLSLADYDNRSGKACANAAMKTQASFQDFDFTNVWTMGGSATYPYPELRAAPMTAAFNGPTVGKTSVGATTTTEPDAPTYTISPTTTTATDETPDLKADTVPWWVLIPMGAVLLVIVVIIILLLRQR